ncbi:LON peptidase substrate-binding domain-containing protein [Candidatus Pelagibacter sp.]|nr:LON peptidase substrate-binding domain-containing protein [Candidatus Pelagibacter sp.]
MDKKAELPLRIPIFPLSNFIIFPNTTVPLNIFEPRYIQMIDDSMKSDRMIGMIQPKKSGKLKKPDLYEVGCIGKITSFNETEDGRYLIIINGVSRFNVEEEIETNKLYRVCKVNYKNYIEDVDEKVDKFKLKDLDKIFKDLKNLFEKKGFMVDWSNLKKQDFSNTLNTLSMASPFSLEEKQVLLETKDLNTRKLRLEEILKTYTLDEFSNKTIQ